MSGAPIFISYRRGDAQHAVDRVVGGLIEAFGKQAVFRDLHSIELGQNFPKRLTEAVRSARVMLVMIGPSWAATTNFMGAQRLASPDDWVRLEIELAKRLHVQILPILVDREAFPQESELPSSLAWLLKLNAQKIGQDPYFKVDTDKLIDHLAIGMGIERSSASSDLRKRFAASEDPDEVQSLIETFKGTNEALEAGARLPKLEKVIELRDAMGRFNFLQEVGHEEELVRTTYLTLEAVDKFLDGHSDTEWTVELMTMRNSLRTVALHFDGFEASDGEIFNYEDYVRDRELRSKPCRD